MSRLPEIGATDDPVVARVFERFEKEGRDPVALYRVLAGTPALLEGYSALSAAIRDRTTLPRSLRELVILRAAELVGSDYEWSHHRKMALAAGVDEEQISGLREWASGTGFDARERAALSCAERVHALDLDDRDFAELRQLFDPDEVIELVLIVSFYEMVARLIQALGVEVEDDYEEHLADAPGRRAGADD